MSAWSTEEDLQLIFRVCGLALKAPWSELESKGELPPGRTRKACEHRIAKLRELVAANSDKKIGEVAVATPRKRAPAGTNKTPKKTPSERPRKRKRTEKYASDSEEEDKAETMKDESQEAEPEIEPAAEKKTAKRPSRVKKAAKKADDESEEAVSTEAEVEATDEVAVPTPTRGRTGRTSKNPPAEVVEEEGPEEEQEVA